MVKVSLQVVFVQWGNNSFLKKTCAEYRSPFFMTGKCFHGIFYDNAKYLRNGFKKAPGKLSHAKEMTLSATGSCSFFITKQINGLPDRRAAAAKKECNGGNVGDYQSLRKQPAG
ncbi:hypothetical protein Y1Q_0009345 [Alligator mississippiensis]|uniref:Uncharacterized protein n=1 Tax=Alligator mississippiensis TaxID=8496 RepID=A0A151N819_ALLMI|nr:hypothetical protein Y1Q_0009345 [Alligator mississippiensis]